MKERTINTLFMLMSVDGKINSGSSDVLNIDRDWRTIAGLGDGIQQYYDLEQETDLFSFISAKTLAQIGVNDRRRDGVDDSPTPPKIPVTFITVDNRHHLTKSGLEYLADWTKKAIVVTTNSTYDTFGLPIDVIHYTNGIDFPDLFVKLKSDYGADRVTIQGGATINGSLLHAKVLDFVNIVVAPVLVGGKNTPTLIDGDSITSVAELSKLVVLELTECKVLNNSYINLRYKVIK